MKIGYSVPQNFMVDTMFPYFDSNLFLSIPSFRPLPYCTLKMACCNNHRSSKAQVIFEEAQQIIDSMRFPQQLRDAMRKAMGEVGTKDGEERLTKL